MKFIKLIFFFTLSLTFQCISAQVKMPLHTKEILEKLSVLSHPKNNLIYDDIRRQNPWLIRIDGNWHIALSGRRAENFNPDELEALGIRMGAQAGRVISLYVPLASVSKVFGLSGISYLEVPPSFEPEIEAQVKDTRADSVHLGINLPMPYNGKGVIVGVLDWGFDFTHPMFYDTSLTRNRIIACWDMYKEEGRKPKYGYGSVYMGKDELMQMQSDTANERGIATHGTHVAGIAGGGGGGVGFRGAAYDCEFIFAQYLRGATSFMDAIDWMKEVADQQGKRLVINMSFGNYHRGTMDTNSLYHEAIRYYTQRGVVLVTSAGNNGGSNMHVLRHFNNDTMRSQISMLPKNTTFPRFAGHTVVIWGERNRSFKAGLEIYSGSNQLLGAGPLYNTSGWNRNLDTFMVLNDDTLFYRIEAEASHPLNDKPTMTIHLSKTNDSWKIGLVSTATQGAVHYWNMVRDVFAPRNTGYPMLAMLPGWTAGNDSFTLSDPGASSDIIVVAAHRSSRFNAGTESPGIIASFSSRGPTIDGILKPDLSAPGVDVASAVSSFSTENNTLIFPYDFNGKTYHFAQFSGTSMSGPAVAGIVALMLQANPGLSHFQIMDILRKTARRDMRMPNMPQEGNNIWGQGKATATAALQLALITASNPVIFQKHGKIYPVPAKDYLIFEDETLSKNFEYEIYDLTGRMIKSGESTNGQEIALRDIGSGMYFLFIKGPTSRVLKFSIAR